MNSRMQKLFGVSTLLAATLLLLAFLAVDPVAANGDLRVYRQGLDVEIENDDGDNVADDDIAEILEELKDIDFEAKPSLIENLMMMKESEAIATEEETIADEEEGTDDEDDVGVEEESEDSEDEVLAIDSVGIESSIPGCSKPDPPTPAPLPVCDSDDGDDDDDGKGKKGGGKKSGGKGKKGGSYHHKEESDDSDDTHGKTFLEVPCGSQLVLEGSTPCFGPLTIIPVPVDAPTVVLTADIVCEGRGSIVAVCSGVTLDGDQKTISANGRRGSFVFLDAGSSLTNTVVENFRTGVVALSLPGGPVTVSDTVIQGSSRSGMIAFLFQGMLSMTNVDILDNRRNGMVLIPIQSTVSMDTLNINSNGRRGIIAAMTGSTWTANALNTSQNNGNGIAVFTIPRASNTVNFDGVVSNENGRNGLRIRHFTPQPTSWTIENSEFSHNGQNRPRDGINAIFPRGTFTLSNVELNGNTSDGLDLRSFRRSNQITLEHIEAVGNVDDGIDLERRGTVSFDSVFACANGDDDIDVRNYLVTSWSDTTCDTRDLFRRLRNLRCSMECPAECNVPRPT